MPTRIEKVAQDIALTAAKMASAAQNNVIDEHSFEAIFDECWPQQYSDQPVTDAISAAAQAASCYSTPDQRQWITAIKESWQPAVTEVIAAYLTAAKESFEKGEALKGSENLTDAVRATLGSIAAQSNWPHRTDDDLFTAAAALGSGTDWPKSEDDFANALAARSALGRRLGSALGASIGLPESIAFGSYDGHLQQAGKDGFSFAATVMEIADRLAEPEPAAT